MSKLEAFNEQIAAAAEPRYVPISFLLHRPDATWMDKIVEETGQSIRTPLVNLAVTVATYAHIARLTGLQPVFKTADNDICEVPVIERSGTNDVTAWTVQMDFSTRNYGFLQTMQRYGSTYGDTIHVGIRILAHAVDIGATQLSIGPPDGPGETVPMPGLLPSTDASPALK